MLGLLKGVFCFMTKRSLVVLGLVVILFLAGGFGGIFFFSPAVPSLVAEESSVPVPQYAVGVEEVVIENGREVVVPQGSNEYLVAPDEEQNGFVRVVLVAGEHEYESWGIEGKTVYQVMEDLRSNQGFAFGGRDFLGLGFFVEEINGIAQKPREDMYWIYYINGEKSKVGVSQYVVKPDDAIEWKYENEE